MGTKMSRRCFVGRGLQASTVLPLLSLTIHANAATSLPPLDPTDPTAKALGFALDTSKVDGTANPSHKAEQRCGTCAQYQGAPSDASGGCNIFAGKNVPKNGWCKVWAQKPGA